MTKTAIVTDSSSGITQKEAEEAGIYVLPMPFLIDGESYFEDVNLTQEEFYRRLASDAGVSTSQPSVGSVMEQWTEILKKHDELVHIPLSSGLSQSCATAAALSKDFEGRVHVVNNQRVSITQKESVYDALALAKSGKTATEITAYLEKTRLDSSIYIAVDTMKYLKKGGRVTPAAAAIGSILRIKPVLQIQGDKLDKFALARSLAKAKETMKNAVMSDLKGRFKPLVSEGKMTLSVAHTQNDEEAAIFTEELKAMFPDVPMRFCDPLPLNIACHIGPGALAVACARRVTD